MHALFKILRRFSEILEKVEEKTKSSFVAVAIILYAGSLVILAGKINPLANLDEFLVKALANLSIPFGIILLQELFELINTIPKSTLQSTSLQFELIALVILRSFFKDFYKLNKAVAAGEVSLYIKLAVVKVVSLAIITYLIIVFKRLSKRAGVERHNAQQSNANHLKQIAVLLLCGSTLAYMIGVLNSFEIMGFIRIVFTGMIVLDAVFFLWMISQNHEFDSLMFDGNLVISLIFARFPLFAVNLVSFPMAVIGVLLATGGMFLFIRPTELRFLGNPQEDDVARYDMTIRNPSQELDTVNKKTALFLRQFNVGDDIAKKIRLSIEEMVTTIISNACKDKKDHEISIGLALCGNRLTVTFSDDGFPFNPFKQDVHDTEAPLEERDLDGLGIFLVRSMMDKVAYNRQTGKNVSILLIHLQQPNHPGEKTG